MVRRSLFGGVLFLLYFAVAPGTSLGGEVVIRLPARLGVRSFSFYLGEYADITGSKRDVALAGGVLVEATDGSLSRGKVLGALGRLRSLGVECRVSMPNSVRLSLLGEGSLEARVARAARWPWRVEALGDPAPGDLVLPFGFRDGFPFVYVRRGESQLDKVSLRWWQPVAIALSPLRRGERIDPSQVALGLVDRPGFEGLPSSLDEVVGNVVRIPIRAGNAIRKAWLLGEPLVSGGQQVSLICTVGGVEVMASGRSMDGGRLGDRVRVLNLSSRRVVTGFVEGPGVVRVKEGDG